MSDNKRSAGAREYQFRTFHLKRRTRRIPPSCCTSIRPVKKDREQRERERVSEVGHIRGITTREWVREEEGWGRKREGERGTFGMPVDMTTCCVIRIIAHRRGCLPPIHRPTNATR
jgi:hypothetical protein